jgi:hypothetical protein
MHNLAIRTASKNGDLAVVERLLADPALAWWRTPDSLSVSH